MSRHYGSQYHQELVDSLVEALTNELIKGFNMEFEMEGETSHSGYSAQGELIFTSTAKVTCHNGALVTLTVTSV